MLASFTYTHPEQSPELHFQKMHLQWHVHLHTTTGLLQLQLWSVMGQPGPDYLATARNTFPMCAQSLPGSKQKREGAVCFECKGDKKLESIKRELRMKTVIGHWQESTGYSRIGWVKDGPLLRNRYLKGKTLKTSKGRLDKKPYEKTTAHWTRSLKGRLNAYEMVYNGKVNKTALKVSQRDREAGGMGYDFPNV